MITLFLCIYITITVASFILVIKPGVNEVQQSRLIIRLAYEEMVEKIDIIKRQYVIIEDDINNQYAQYIEEANNEYNVLLQNVVDKYDKLEEEIGLSYASKYDEINRKQNELSVKRNTEFFKNGLSIKYYELSDEVDKLWSEERALDTKKRDEERALSSKEEEEKRTLNDQKYNKIASLNKDEEQEIENLISKRNNDINKIKNHNDNKTDILFGGIVKIGVGVIIVFILIGYAVRMYNSLINLLNMVREKWSQIEVLLKQRADLIPNILETVKGYSKFEKDTLEAVVKARNKTLDAKTKEQEIKANKEMKNTLNKLLILMEDYPELKANVNFMNLQKDLKEMEDGIAIARHKYNEVVLKYKNKLEMFPSSMIAALFNFKGEAFFDIDGEDLENPTISFS